MLWRIAVGLRYARTLMFRIAAGARAGVQNFILLITAGQSNNQTLTLVYYTQPIMIIIKYKNTSCC